MTTSRPSRLVYQTRDGVHSTFVGGKDSGPREYQEFVNLALDWGEPHQYSILDTFMSDSMSVDLFEQLLRRVTTDRPLRLLLANPVSNFAVARGASIQQNALLESCQGIGAVRQALDRVRGGLPRGRQWIPDGTESQIEHICSVLDSIHAHELSGLVDVRFYEDAPSGPLYFFGDIVVCGRFAAGSSSVSMPWSMVVDHPLFDHDYFDALRREFEYLWSTSSSTIGAGAMEDGGVFLSYADSDHELGSRLFHKLQDAGVSTFMAKRHVRVADNWTDALRLHLSGRSTLVALLTPAGCRSEWVRNEIAGAWALGKKIVPMLVGVEDQDMPELAASRQGFKVASLDDLDAAFAAVAALLGASHG